MKCFLVYFHRYGDAVIELDSGVGRILHKLKSLGIDKDTLVIFSSDNGGATYAKEQGIVSNGHKFKYTVTVAKMLCML